VPTYQYACTACDHAFEQVQSFNDESLTTCPQCQGQLRKIFNAVGVVFKGSGFYRTDSRSDRTSTTSSNGSSNGSSSGSADTSSSSSSGEGAKSASTSSTSDRPTAGAA
jgi:putative FmdB family regulatory protein